MKAVMLPTPSTSHVSFDKIYEPAEDSFLLLDTFSKGDEKLWLTARFSSKSTPFVLEIGTGSGVVIAFVTANAKYIFGQDIVSMGVDINRHASESTALTVRKAIVEQSSKSIFLGAVCANLFEANLTNTVDVLIFNPPYVPTAELPVQLSSTQSVEDDFSLNSHLLELSYAGGKDGMETTWQLLRDLPTILSSRGVAYILLCRQNKPEEVKNLLLKLLHGEWQIDMVANSGKTAGWERLQIMRICRHLS